jgi:hypothetical protein
LDQGWKEQRKKDFGPCSLLRKSKNPNYNKNQKHFRVNGNRTQSYPGAEHNVVSPVKVKVPGLFGVLGIFENVRPQGLNLYIFMVYRRVPFGYIRADKISFRSALEWALEEGEKPVLNW